MAPNSRFMDDAALDAVVVVDLTQPRPVAGADPAGLAARPAARGKQPDLAVRWA
jgi:hypothetical protein